MEAPIFLLLICGIIWLVFRPLTIGYQPHVATPKEREAQKLWDKRNAHRAKIREFIELFGFDPSLLDEERYAKEIFLKLAFLAREIKNSGIGAAKSPHIYRDSYAAASKKYMDALALIGYFDPEFQKGIPHWTELHGFIDRWMRGERVRSGKRQQGHRIVTA